MTPETCENRIESRLKRRLEDVNQWRAWYDSVGDDDADPALATFAYEEGLSEDGQTYLAALDVSPSRTLRVLLSTGGPGDWVDLHFDDGEITGGVYAFQDWYDVAYRPLSSDDAQAFGEAYAVSEWVG